MGMFESISTKDANTWDDVLGSLCRSRGGFESVEDFMLACAEDDPDEAIRALECLEWLGLSGKSKVASTTTHGAANIVDLFCQRLEEKLFYGENERDMAVMHHTIGAAFEDGTTEEHHSSLQTFGDRSMTAMCKTVGFTAAASTELILSGSLRGNHRGLLLPTRKEIYVPVLEAVRREGIIFEETVKVVAPASSTLPLH
jgi:hypothetical protein